MTLSLDANVLIDLVNARQAAVRRGFDAAVEAGETLVTCSLAAHELMFGASISHRPAIQAEASRRLLADVAVADFTLEDAKASVEVRTRLRSVGRSIGPFDTLIAGQALNRGWTMVTANIREFGRVPGLDLVDWRAPPN